MAGEQTKEQPTAKLQGTFPGAATPSQPWYLGPYAQYYQMAGYHQQYPLVACPFHVQPAGLPFTPAYGCPYCVPMQPLQQSQNININVGGGFVPSGHNPYFQASLLGAKYSGYPALVPVAANGSAWGWGQHQTTWPGQTRAQQESMLHARSDNQPQDMQPSDPDPWRFYTVRELDGGITSRNRYTIDSGEIGKVRWYQTPQGVFYAVIIPDSKA